MLNMGGEPGTISSAIVTENQWLCLFSYTGVALYVTNMPEGFILTPVVQY